MKKNWFGTSRKVGFTMNVNPNRAVEGLHSKSVTLRDLNILTDIFGNPSNKLADFRVNTGLIWSSTTLSMADETC